MENQNGFVGKKNWYRGNLHSHSTNSDGCLNPKEVAALYKKNGYHFLCLSEHDMYTDYRKELGEANFLILPGLEASVSLRDKEGEKALGTHHIHGILGTKEQQKRAKKSLFQHMEQREVVCHTQTWNEYEEAQCLCDELRGKGMFTTYNHPVWSKVSEEAVCRLQDVWAIEIYNYNTVNESGTGYNTTFWDRMLRMGKSVYGFASDDNHNEGIFPDSCGGYVMVNADNLTHEEIVSSLQAGNYYSTSGPDIFDWGIRGGAVYVVCSPASRVNFICGNGVNYGGTVMGKEGEDEITHAEYKLSGQETYVRVECVDRFGRTAWSNALFL